MVWSISQQKHVHTLRGHVDEIEVITQYLSTPLFCLFSITVVMSHTGMSHCWLFTVHGSQWLHSGDRILGQGADDVGHQTGGRGTDASRAQRG